MRLLTLAGTVKIYIGTFANMIKMMSDGMLSFFLKEGRVKASHIDRVIG